MREHDDPIRRSALAAPRRIGRSVRHVWDTELDERRIGCRWSSCRRHGYGRVREEHVLACALGEDGLAGDSSRFALLEAGLGETVGRRVAGKAMHGASGEAWIADGNYYETLDLRLERTQTVVVLDTRWWICAGRAFVRGFRKPGELPEGCDDSARRRLRDEWRLVGVVWRNRRSEPERERAIISQYGSHAALHVLGSRRAAKAFLSSLTGDEARITTSQTPTDNPA
jgi:hypothetical protein